MLQGEFMSDFKIILAAAIFSLITGCSSNQYSVTDVSENQYSVTYASEPPGAEIYCNGVAKGYAPVTLYYTLDDDAKKRGVLNTVPCGVKWVSGATARANSQFDLNQFPNGVISTVRRPNEPNAHVDHSFALQLKQSQQLNQILRNQQGNQFLGPLQINQVLGNQESMQNEQQRVRNKKQHEDNTQYLCNLGLLNSPGCK
jgi:hypothetical protein